MNAEGFDSSFNQNQPFEIRSGEHIASLQFEEMTRLADGLLHAIQARMVIIIDLSGQVITARGMYQEVDLVILGALVAGDLAASQEIARLMGAYRDYQLVTREGAGTTTFIADAGEHFALFVQIGDEVPIGWARVKIRHTAEQLAAIPVTPSEDGFGMIASELMDDGETTDLSDLFGQALDDLWSD